MSDAAVIAEIEVPLNGTNGIKDDCKANGNANVPDLTSIKNESKEEIVVDEKETLKRFREKLEVSPDLVTKLRNFTDDFLLKFLRSSNFQLQQALDRVQYYLKMREKYPEMFLLPEGVKCVYDDNGLSINDVRRPSGEFVLIGRPGLWNPSTYKFDMIINATVTALETAVLNEEVQQNGLVAVIDMKGFGLKHLPHFNIIRAKRIAELVEKALPIKLLEIHVINESKITALAYAVIKPFLSADFKKKIRFYGQNSTEFYTFVPKEILPSDFGGTQAAFSSEKWYQKLVSQEEDLKKYWASCQ